MFFNEPGYSNLKKNYLNWAGFQETDSLKVLQFIEYGHEDGSVHCLCHYDIYV